MAVVSTHLTGSLRFVDATGGTIQSYHRIRPNIQAVQVESFLGAVALLRGELGGNAFLTLTTELEEASA